MEFIYHIAKREEWETSKRAGKYAFDALSTEGFIHCSTKGQLPSVAERFFKGQQDLVLLKIDVQRVVPLVKYENCEGGEEVFPHIYGELNIDAVVDVQSMKRDEVGQYIF